MELSKADVETLIVYTNATRLFLDCLQVAYVADRQGVEERIIWVPG